MNDQITLFDLTMPMVSIERPIRLVELFAGYGSQAMALKRLGADFEHYRVIEFDKFAIRSYNAVHGTDFPTVDVCTVKGVDLGIVDKSRFTYLLTYSFPCTDISVAGQQKGMAKGSETRSGLLWEVERILNELHDTDSLPQILIMENVDAITNQRNKPHLMKWTEFLDGLGYTSYGHVLNSFDYGIAQNRKRYFLVSLLGEYNYKFPDPIELDTCIEDYFEKLSEEQALRQICKGQKALDLMVDLDAENKLE